MVLTWSLMRFCIDLFNWYRIRWCWWSLLGALWGSLLIFSIDLELGMMMVLTWSLMRLATDTGERWRRGVEHLLHRGEASRALKKNRFFYFFSPLSTAKLKGTQKRLWTLILKLLQSGSQTVKWYLCWQMCFYPRTNLFAHKYVSHQLTNILWMVAQIYLLILHDKPTNLFV